MRTRDNNPFRPGAGAVPDVWVGRERLLSEHASRRRDRVRGRYTTGVVLVGPSGIGKSVLANRMAQEAAVSGDVVLDPVRIAKRSDPVAQLAGVVRRAATQVAGTPSWTEGLGRLLDRLEVISVKGVTVAVGEEQVSNPHLAVRDTLVELGTALARENGRGRAGRERALVLRLDELQNASNAQRSALVAALGDVLEAQADVDVPGDRAEVFLPVVLVLTGLPDLLNAASNVDTFRRRFATHVLRPFTDAEVEDALLDTDLPDGVAVAPDAAAAVVDVVCGDPFLFQLVGHHAWNASHEPALGVGDVEAARMETYPVRLRIAEAAAADIPGAERTVLDAILEVCGADLLAIPKDVADRMGVDVTQIATAAGRLERRAVIERRPQGWQIVHRLLHRYLTTGDV